MTIESEELYRYLSEIAERSFAGEIPWNQPNPSTFQWIRETEEDQFVAIIQKASGPRIRDSSGLIAKRMEESSSYLFQVQSRRTRQTIMSLSSAERPELNDVLKHIYLGAEKGIDVRSSQILKKLLSE